MCGYRKSIISRYHWKATQRGNIICMTWWQRSKTKKFQFDFGRVSTRRSDRPGDMYVADQVSLIIWNVRCQRRVWSYEMSDWSIGSFSTVPSLNCIRMQTSDFQKFLILQWLLFKIRVISNVSGPLPDQIWLKYWTFEIIQPGVSDDFKCQRCIRYDTSITLKVGAAKDLGAAIGVAINGINIQVTLIKRRSSDHQGPMMPAMWALMREDFNWLVGGMSAHPPPTWMQTCQDKSPGDAHSACEPQRHPKPQRPDRGLPASLPLPQVAWVPSAF